MHLLHKALLLAGIPLVVLSAIGIALLAQGDEANGRATLAVAVIVAAVSGSSVLYQVERWSLRRQSVAHLAIMVVTVLPALLLSGWFPLDDAWDVALVVGIFLATGLVLWSILFLVVGVLVPRASTRARAD